MLAHRNPHSIVVRSVKKCRAATRTQKSRLELTEAGELLGPRWRRRDRMAGSTEDASSRTMHGIGI